MRLSLLKSDTKLFCVRGGIIAINGKNAIEANRRVNKRIFLIGRIIRTDLFFYIVNDFGFLVVLQPGNSPFRNFIFSFPYNRNRVWIQTRHISKLFYSQFALFKFIFEVLIIHLVAFIKLSYLKLYQKLVK